MSKNQEYALQYADYAMAQMRRYGIPASVTLAQGILESSNGQSRLARNENNHFGIKATPSWIAGGGKYGIYTMISRMKSSAAMTAWVIHTSITPAFEGEQPLCRLLQTLPGRLQGLGTKH